jgi:hypothetical protein
MILISFWVVALSVLSSLIIPDSAWAWGPSTHLQFGLQLLDKLSILPSELQVLLGFYKQQYLYGCISADIIVGKKFIEYRHHCHNWAVGMELLAKSSSDSLRAFMFGYLSHLAADTVAHNLYVPLKSLESYQNPAMGHLYWELMYDKQLTDERMLDMFYSLSRNPFIEEDRFLGSLLKPTLFSFTTNKKIFNGLLILQRLERWQELMRKTSERKPVALLNEEMQYYSELSMNAIVSFLIDRESSSFFRLDPTGHEALERANLLARSLKKERRELADPVIEQLPASLEELKTRFNEQLHRKAIS